VLHWFRADRPGQFRGLPDTGGPMRLAGWRFPVVVDLAGLAIPSQSRPIRFGHDPLSGVGHTDSIRVGDGRLTATGVVSRDTAAAREVVASARNGFPWQASIGAAVEQFDFVKENQSVLVNGREFVGPLNVVRKSTLGEISFVDLGADGNTSASVAARQAAANQEKAVMDETKNGSEAKVVQAGAEAGTATSAPAGKTQGGSAATAPKIEAQAAPAVKAGTPAGEGVLTLDPVEAFRKAMRPFGTPSLKGHC
jgi:hypothetical protein